jgi:steroid 5-alpha reductase family enzyme
MPHDFWFLIGIGALVAFALFFITWLLSLKLNNFSFVDVAWSYGLTFLAPLYAFAGNGFTQRKIIAVTMAMVWSLRLGTYLFVRIKRHHPHEDARYQVLREKWKGSLARSFFSFFQAQAALILLLSVPILLACLNPSPQISFLEWIGFAVWLIGIGGEALSDAQMQRFKSDPASKGKVCEVGLWRVAIYAPLMILYFLLRVTGIPLTEECAVKSKGAAYREYQRTTSPFIPWFRRA